MSFWSALLLPLDKIEFSIMYKLRDFVKSCLKEHPDLFCGYTVLHAIGSLILGWTASTVLIVISILEDVLKHESMEIILRLYDLSVHLHHNFNVFMFQSSGLTAPCVNMPTVL